MTTDDLIARLAASAGPVQPLRPPSQRLVAWLPLALAAVAIAVVVFGLRSDRAILLTLPTFLIDAAVALVVLVSGGAAALLLGVPGAETRPTARVLALFALAVWLGVTLRAVVETGHGFEQATHWPACAARALAVAVLPAAALLRLVGRAAPVQPGWAVGLAVAASMAAGALAVALTCPLTDPGHILLGHAAPVVLTAGLAAWMAGYWPLAASR